MVENQIEAKIKIFTQTCDMTPITVRWIDLAILSGVFSENISFSHGT